MVWFRVPVVVQPCLVVVVGDEIFHKEFSFLNAGSPLSAWRPWDAKCSSKNFRILHAPRHLLLEFAAAAIKQAWGARE